MKLRTLLLAAVVVAVPVTAAALALAALAGDEILDVHLSVSMVDASLPVGAGVSVVQTCPAGHRLDRSDTKALGDYHDEHLRLAGAEYWAAGMVTRYHVARKTRANEPVAVVNAIVCTSPLAAGATRVKGAAKADLRVWGPAPASVALFNGVLMIVTDDLGSTQMFRTSMKAAGVDSATGSLRDALDAMQAAFEADEDALPAVVATAETRRRVPAGSFVSMRNNYRFNADLTQIVSF